MNFQKVIKNFDCKIKGKLFQKKKKKKVLPLDSLINYEIKSIRNDIRGGMIKL